MTLAADEFIRRFLLHVLPKGFHRIRHYGLLASAGCKANIARAKELIGAPIPQVEPPAAHDTADPHATTDHRPPCPCCGGRMIIVEVFARGAQPRGPPSSDAGIGCDPMTILVLSQHHRFAGTSRSRRPTPFIPAHASANSASPTSPQSGRWTPQPPSIRSHNRLPALSDPKKTIPRQTRCGAKSP